MNGFIKQQLSIGGKQPVHQTKECNKCNEMKVPEGGIQMSQNKWYCAGCWAHKVCDPSLETEAMKEMRDKLAWNSKYIDMLEELVCHYQKEVNFWKGRE